MTIQIVVGLTTMVDDRTGRLGFSRARTSGAMVWIDLFEDPGY